MKYLFILLLVVGLYRVEAQSVDSLYQPGTPFVVRDILHLPAEYSIVSFVFEIYTKDFAFIEKNKGPELNTKCCEMLNMVQPGSKISIYDVILERDGKEIKCKGRTLTLAAVNIWK